MSNIGVKLIERMNLLGSNKQFLINVLRYQSISASKLIYSEYGDPMKVVQKCKDDIPHIKENQVLIKMIAAPVNPADINTIQGKYPSRPTLPAVPGNEGVGEIVKVGSDVEHLKSGDHVVPLSNALGTWRTHMILNSQLLLKVPKDLGIIEAATLTVNPCTAYRMLTDFTELKTDDVVIQNGANSACGQNVIQIAKAWGVKTVNVIRDRPNLKELVDFLKSLGATEVLTEEELRTTDLFKSKRLPKPRLGLNCVGGKSALEVMRHLANGSPIVTYGGMSREPVTVPTSALIFKDIQVRGFWMTEWSNKNAKNTQRFDMFEKIISLMKDGKLHGPAYKMVAFDQFQEALLNTMTVKGMIGKKYVLDFEKC